MIAPKQLAIVGRVLGLMGSPSLLHASGFQILDQSADFPLIDFKPTRAYKVNDQFSVGIGLDI